MFSGIIYHQANTLSISDGVFEMENVFSEVLDLGESIAHDGACMTVTSSDEKTYTFQAVAESLDRTNFWSKRPGDTFHVERSITMDQRLDGHLVTGHVDTVWEVDEVILESDGSKKLFIQYAADFDRLVVEKGSITIDGVSLTVVDDEPSRLSVVIIPQTQELTHLGSLQKDDVVNLEFDMMAKYIAKNFQLSSQ